MLVPCDRHDGEDVVLKSLSPSSGKKYVCLGYVWRQPKLVLQERMGDEEVSVVEEENKEQKRTHQIMAFIKLVK